MIEDFVRLLVFRYSSALQTNAILRAQEAVKQVTAKMEENIEKALLVVADTTVGSCGVFDTANVVLFCREYNPQFSHSVSGSVAFVALTPSGNNTVTDGERR